MILTPGQRPVTETVTAVETAVATALFTEGLTATAATETLLFTETTTVTASQTNMVSETVTVVVTSTTVQQADTTVTSTSTSYQAGVTLKARRTVSAVPAPLPVYASEVCADWDQYTKACDCAGFETTTVTVPGAAETVTVTASDAATTTVGTVSATLTETVFVTATALATEIDTISVTEIATSTTAVTIFSTTTVTTTSTPTSVVPLTCKPVGVNFRLRNSAPFPDGSTRWMNKVGTIVAWQSGFSVPPTSQQAETSTWVLDSNGFFESASASFKDYVPAFDKTSTRPSVSVDFKLRTDVEAGVAAGTLERVKTCVNAATNIVTMSADGRHNMLSCGNSLYISTGDGGDVWSSGCVLLNPIVA